SEFVINLSFFTIAVFIVYYFILEKINITSEINSTTLLVLSFILFFQGLFLIASRKDTIAQIIGFIEEENSIIIFGILTAPIPFLIEANIFLDVLGLIVISSILTLQKTEHSQLEELKG
ncbi:MAG: hydrogenase, partial [Saccharolobus sp.]